LFLFCPGAESAALWPECVSPEFALRIWEGCCGGNGFRRKI
jgi:hypothetical protein